MALSTTDIAQTIGGKLSFMLFTCSKSLALDGDYQHHGSDISYTVSLESILFTDHLFTIHSSPKLKTFYRNKRLTSSLIGQLCFTIPQLLPITCKYLPQLQVSETVHPVKYWLNEISQSTYL